MRFSDLQSFVSELSRRKDLVEITAPVDPRLELAEIHRRVISENGPALLFRNVIGSSFPVVTNLFGSDARVRLAFGDEMRSFIEELAHLPEQLVSPSLGLLWEKKGILGRILGIGTKTGSKAEVLYSVERNVRLDQLPVITSWVEDGGPFITLPLVFTEHPETGVHNLGMYRLQRFDEKTTGLHMQIGKGGGFHLARAGELGRRLPVNVFIGGPPAAILAAIAPLPENVPELLLASLVLGEKFRLAKNPAGPLPIMAEAEFALIGYSDPKERRPEGPFGDHYGYYSLTHDFPVFHCEAVLHRKNAIYPATVVGKPRQEDYYIGNYLQEMLSPLFPIVMPAVKNLWSYGETGYHSLAAAVVKQRYKREAMVSAFRILGEGQLSLTKFLLLIDKDIDLKNFTAVLEHVLERVDFRTDLYVFSNLSMDTLDYTGPTLNEGSKGVMLGVGEPIRSLPGEFRGSLPSGITTARVFCRGCLVVSGPSFKSETQAAARIAADPSLVDWPLIILADDAEFTGANSNQFLWSTFTRFEPAQDIHSAELMLHRFHPVTTPPIVIDARMKPNYPGELFCDEVTSSLVDKRWGEYFKK